MHSRKSHKNNQHKQKSCGSRDQTGGFGQKIYHVSSASMYQCSFTKLNYTRWLVAFTHLGKQQYEITYGIQSVLLYTQISPPATPSKDSASTPVVQEKKRGIRHQWCEGEGSVMNNSISQCSVLNYVEGLLPLTPCTVYTRLQQQRHVMHAHVGSGESTDKHDFNTYLQKHTHIKNCQFISYVP